MTNPLVIDVRDYGAVFDNSTDDTAAIQAALDAAPVPGFSGNDVAASIVQLPAGRARVTQLRLPPNVWLRGHGPSSTYLQATDPTLDVITLKTGDVVQTTISDLGIIGGPNPTSGAGINFSQGGMPGILGDSRHVVRDVVIVGTFNGVQGSGGSEIRLDRVTVQRPIERGFYFSSTDMFISNCTVGQAPLYGFDIFGGNSRIWGCKAFGGGDGNWWRAGFSITGSGRHQVACCEVQDFNGSGFSIGGNQVSTLTGCLADSCSKFGFHVGATNTAEINGGVVIARPGGVYVPFSAVNMPDAAGNRVNVTVDGYPFPMLSQKATPGGYVVMSNMLGAQAISYAPTITPDLYAGGTVFVGVLTGNLTIADPSTARWAVWPLGARLAFYLTQDAAAGRKVTFGSTYKLVAGTLASTTAGKTRRIEFEYDGTVWRETNRN